LTSGTYKEVLRAGLSLIVYLILDNILLQFKELLYILWLLSIAIAGTEDIQHIYDISKCQKCDGLYRVENYRLLTWYYKTNFKANTFKETTVASTPCPYTFKCLNSKEDHAFDNNKCLF